MSVKSPLPPFIEPHELVGAYDCFLFDAFGVLVDLQAPIPGASAILRDIEACGKNYLILTNSVFSAAQCAAKMARKGLHVPESRFVSSGDYLKDELQKRAHALPVRETLRVYVVGDFPDQATVASWGCARVNEPMFHCMVIGDQGRCDLTEALDQAVSVLLHQKARGSLFDIILPNPDVIYPKAAGTFGVTSGAMALILERALRVQSPGVERPFVVLGKPSTGIFQRALARLPKRGRTVMIGDQLLTDVQGAQNAGLDSVLMLTGVSSVDSLENSPIRPTYLMRSLGGAAL